MSHVSRYIGICAMVYVIALITGIIQSQGVSFNYSLILIVFSPILVLISALGLVLELLSLKKSKQKSVSDYGSLINIVLNLIGIITPFTIPFIVNITLNLPW